MTLNHALWRTHPHTIDVYVYVHTPDVIFECGIDSADYNHPVEIVFTDVTIGAYTDVRADMTWRAVATDGTIRGYGRIRKAATADTLYINRVAQGEIPLSPTDRIEVLDDYRIWAKLPYIDPNTGQIYKDYDRACTNEGYYPPPVVIAGPGYAKHSHTLNYADVEFDFRDTYAWGHSSQGIVTSGYTVEHDGSPGAGNLTNGYGTIRFMGGMHWVHATATEDVNNDTFTRHIPVYIANNTTYPPTPAQVTALRGTPEGWQVEFNILDADIAAAVLPGSLVMVWAEERYGSTEGSLIGHNDREQMLFVGWLSEDRSIFDDALSDAEFIAVGPLGKLRELPMMSQSTSRNGNTTLWNIIYENTMTKHLVYLLMWHSTILNVADLEEPDWADTYPIIVLDAGQEGGISNLFDVVNGQPGAGSVGARFTCDHAGQMYLRQVPTYLSSAERSLITVDAQLQSSDWTGKIAIQSNHHTPVAWLISTAIIASGDDITPLRAIAPGYNPAQGGREERYDNLYVLTQYDFLYRVGQQYARLNNPLPPFSITILNGGLVADPAWLHYVEMTLDEATNKRGINFDADSFLLRAVDIEFDHEIGAMLQQWTIESEVSGPIAVAESVPTGDVNRAVSQPARGINLYNPTTTPEGSGVVVAADANTLRRTADWSAATPTWVEKFDPDDWITGGTLTIKDFAMDPYNPGEGCLVAVHDSDGYLHIVRTTQLTNTSPTWATIKSIAVTETDGSAVQVYLRSHSGQAGQFALLVLYGGQVYTYTTTNYYSTTTTWTCPESWPGIGFLGMDTAIYTDHIWVGGMEGYLYHSDDWGASYDEVDITDETGTFPGAAANWGTNMLHIPPYNNSSTANIIILITNNSTGAGVVGETNNTGTDFTDITPSYSGDDYELDIVYPGAVPLRPIVTAWSDKDKIYTALYRPARDVMRFFVYDGSWGMKSDVTSYLPYILAVWPGNDDVVFGVCHSYLIYSEDEGENWATKQWTGFGGGVGIWIGSIG